MLRFAANTSLMYGDLPFIDRLDAAAADGFDLVECQFPYEVPAAEFAARLRANGQALALINLPPGHWGSGDRGLAALSGRADEFKAAFGQALAYAEATGCQRLHVMSGIVAPHAPARIEAHGQLLANLEWALPQAQAAGLTLLLEPINTRDIPGYFMATQEHARDIIDDFASPHLRLQFDAYHCQIAEGDLTRRLQAQAPVIGHVQIAGVPDRHEPDTGELSLPHLLRQIEALGGTRIVGLEYRPRGNTSEGLGWLRDWRAAQA